VFIIFVINKGYNVNEYGFIEFPITNDTLEQARIKAEYTGILNNSIRKGEGNVVGGIGQIAVESVIEGAVSAETYDYDLITQNGLRLEIKTKDRTVIPRPHYECSIAASNPYQNADQYIFVSTHRIDNNFKTAYILGYIDRNEYYKMAVFLKKGDYDPSNNFYVKSDCYNLPIKSLCKFKNMSGVPL